MTWYGMNERGGSDDPNPRWSYDITGLTAHNVWGHLMSLT